MANLRRIRWARYLGIVSGALMLASGCGGEAGESVTVCRTAGTGGQTPTGDAGSTSESGAGGTLETGGSAGQNGGAGDAGGAGNDAGSGGAEGGEGGQGLGGATSQGGGGQSNAGRGGGGTSGGPGGAAGTAGGGAAGTGGTGGATGGTGGTGCGDGIVNGSESCDVRPVFSTGCGADCQPITSAACIACETEEVSVYDCSVLEGMFVQDGPALGLSLVRVCNEVLDCVRDSGCATGMLFSCYCGSASPAVCSAGMPNGPCRTQIERGLETKVYAEIDGRYTNIAFGGGLALFRASQDQVACTTQCLQPSNP